jgi:hypothetical protein
MEQARPGEVPLHPSLLGRRGTSRHATSTPRISLRTCSPSPLGGSSSLSCAPGPRWTNCPTRQHIRLRGRIVGISIVACGKDNNICCWSLLQWTATVLLVFALGQHLLLWMRRTTVKTGCCGGVAQHAGQHLSLLQFLTALRTAGWIEDTSALLQFF